MHLKLCSLQRLWLCVNALIKSPKPCNLSPSPREPSGSNSEIISLSISVDNVPDQHKPTLVEMWSFYTQCKLCTSTNTSPKIFTSESRCPREGNWHTPWWTGLTSPLTHQPPRILLFNSATRPGGTGRMIPYVCFSLSIVANQNVIMWPYEDGDLSLHLLVYGGKKVMLASI